MPGKDINNNRRWYSRITKMAVNRNIRRNRRGGEGHPQCNPFSQV